MALCFPVELKNGVGKALIVASRAHGVGQQTEIFVGSLIAGVQNALDNALLYRLGSVLLDDPKLRRKLRCVTMLAQKALTERVDRTYLRLGAQSALAAQTAVIGVNGQTLGYLVEYAAFKLSGGGLGKGYD